MRMPRNMLVLALAATAVLAACTATTPTEAAAPDAPPSGPPPGASGKLSPEMVGKVSPVPAFMGQGEHLGKRWMIHIRSEGQMRHSVELIWTREHLRREGTLFYRDTPGPSRGAPIALDGTLDTATGKQMILVEIATEACTDDATAAFPQRVKITLQGETGMSGCGELAVY
jgi:hypothetical protein